VVQDGRRSSGASLIPYPRESLSLTTRVATVGLGSRALPWLLLLALALYVPGFWWGAPVATAEDRIKAWAVDDETPLGPLAEIHNIIAPRPDRNLGYPLLYSFLVVGVQAPYLLYLKTTGGLGATAAEYPFGLAEPVSALRMLTWLAHLLTLIMAAGVVAAAYDTGRVLWGERSGILAALFVIFCYPMFYYSRTGNVDVPMLCFMALAVATFARIRVLGLTARRIVALGVFAGAALAVKEEAVGVLLPMALLIVFLPGIFPLEENLVPANRWKLLAFGLAASILALGLGGGFFVEPSRYLLHLEFLTGRLRDAPGAGGLIPFAFPYTVDGNLAYAAQIGGYLADTLTSAGLLLSLAGLVWAVRRHAPSRVIACLLVGFLGFNFVVLRSGQLRYVLPAGFPARAVCRLRDVSDLGVQIARRSGAARDPRRHCARTQSAPRDRSHLCDAARLPLGGSGLARGAHRSWRPHRVLRRLAEVAATRVGRGHRPGHRIPWAVQRPPGRCGQGRRDSGTVARPEAKVRHRHAGPQQPSRGALRYLSAASAL